MTKTQYCLEREKEMVDYYLHASNVQKLLEKMQEELLFEEQETTCTICFRVGYRM